MSRRSALAVANEVLDAQAMRRAGEIAGEALGSLAGLSVAIEANERFDGDDFTLLREAARGEDALGEDA